MKASFKEATAKKYSLLTLDEEIYCGIHTSRMDFFPLVSVFKLLMTAAHFYFQNYNTNWDKRNLKFLPNKCIFCSQFCAFLHWPYLPTAKVTTHFKSCYARKNQALQYFHAYLHKTIVSSKLFLSN